VASARIAATLRPRATRRRHPAPRFDPARQTVAATATARWEEQTVRRDHYGVLAAAWLSETDEHGREVAGTPVLVDIPMDAAEIGRIAPETADGDFGANPSHVELNPREEAR
jgi:hypothetical protein